MKHELVRVTLENEMDLIAAHKRSMKLGELAGLSLASQTTFATAVSEISRNIIDSGKNGSLVLSFETEGYDRYISACLKNEELGYAEGLAYAKRLVNKYTISTEGNETSIELFYAVSPALKLTIAQVDEWRIIFRNEPAVSAYDELKRRTEQLLEVSERLGKSETQYRTLTNSLPMVIFSMDVSGNLIYANEWLVSLTGFGVEHLNADGWRAVVHEEDYDAFSMLLKNDYITTALGVKMQARIKNHRTGEYLWHQVFVTPITNEKGVLQHWSGFLVDIHAQKVVEQTLKDNRELKEAEKRLTENQITLEKYIADLARSNRELQQFAFVASHDLQEPVRKILYYSDYLIDRYAEAMEKRDRSYLQNMNAAALRMRTLIHDLLLYSHINRDQVVFKTVDLQRVATDAIQDMEITIKEKKAGIYVQPLPLIKGDERMLRQLFQNIISNAVKYCRPGEPPEVTISCVNTAGNIEITFKDNGIGFDKQYLPKMFALFQRLHTREAFEGTGLGLAICHKIVEMHNGRIWADSEGQGASFFVSLPMEQSNT